MSEILVHVAGTPVPAVRQTQADRWKKRPVVLNYWAWQDNVVLASRLAGLTRPIENPVEMCFLFGLPGKRGKDIDNLIKGIKDSLVKGGILQDDTFHCVPRYYLPVEAYSVCLFCERRKKKRDGTHHDDCGAVKQCNRGFALFGIRESKSLRSETALELMRIKIGVVWNRS